MSCTTRTNKHGNLCLRLFYQGREWQERVTVRGKPARDNEVNRRRTEARAELISEEMDAGTFEYLKWFPEGNLADEFQPKDDTDKKFTTVGDHYRDWIERKKPPFVRPGLHYDYERQFRRYILPWGTPEAHGFKKLEHVRIIDITLADLEALRSYLTDVMELSLKSCRNIIDGTFRAMMKDARKHGIGEKDYFADLEWPRITTAKPDPFTAEERDAIIAHFKEKRPYYYPFVVTQFGTGARPSEMIALRWGDVDLKKRVISITKSRYMQTDSPTKTAASEREIAIGEPIAAVLSFLKPLHVTEADFVFKNQEGNPISEDKWRGKYWYRALRACGIRPRKFYATRHTFISEGLSHGANIKWLAEYCGTSVAMIEKHYGRYINSDSDEQLRRVFGAQAGTFAGTPRDSSPDESDEVIESVENDEWSGRVDLNHISARKQGNGKP